MMQFPDSSLEEDALVDLAASLDHLHVKVIVVLGPTVPTGGTRVYGVYPPIHAGMARDLCISNPFGDTGTSAGAPMVGWRTLEVDRDDMRKPQSWSLYGLSTMVRLVFPTSKTSCFQVYAFSRQRFTDRLQSAEVAYNVMSAWPTLREQVTRDVHQLTDRECESLLYAADGLTAKETAERMGLTERTVNHHWNRSMAKLEAKNKASAIRTAIVLGLI